MPGREDRYAISSHGRVWSLIHRRLLSTNPNQRNGYLQVSVHRDGGTSTLNIHSVVAEAFIGPRPAGMVVCHLDGDPANPRVSNLVYGTPAENQSHRALHGTDQLGERNPGARLTEDKVRVIRDMYVSGLSATEIARRTGWAGAAAIRMAALGKTWRHVA